MKSVLDAARELAQAHIQVDPETTAVFLVESSNEVRLVEVSGSVGQSGGQVIPFRFAACPERGGDYPSVVVLLSPEEWDAVQKGELNLPEGWPLDTLQKVS